MKVELNVGKSAILYLHPNAIKPDQIELKIDLESVKVPTEIEDCANLKWKTTMLKSPKAFNGPLVSLLSVNYDGKKLLVTGQPTDYKTYSYLRNQPDYQLFQYRIAVMGTSCVLLTSDNKIILATRGENLSGEGNILSIPGGLLTSTQKSFTENIWSELEEELDVEKKDVTSLAFHGIGYDSVHAKGAEFLFSIKTKLTAVDVIDAHIRAKDRHEATKLFAIDESELSNYVRTNRKRIMLGSLANIIAYMHHKGVRNALELERAT